MPRNMETNDQFETVSMPIYEALLKTFATTIDKIQISGIVCESHWIRTTIGMFAEAALANTIWLEKKAGSPYAEEKIIDDLLAAIKEMTLIKLAKIKIMEEKYDENATQH